VADSRDLASWNAYLVTGSYRAAGKQLGIHADTVRRHVAGLKAEYGVTTTAQLAVALGRVRVT
jgi:predicted ArsR family transcriptional regulator